VRRWIALLLFAALLFAAIGGQAHFCLWWAILAPVLFLLGLILLKEEIPEFRFAPSAAPVRLALSARAPPLS
jgi:hypothetical protein